MSIFKYEEIEKCVSAISERVGEQLEMVNYNTSPKIDDAISAADQVLCRSMLKREYEIYDAL
ncbi:hypothetical protein GCM10017044_01380 [Kordiimonas sediminis]|uniref:Uncharacterized protein n=2 Tax=Kordiimonas sediminis TaxID=1735581 RepID=A0A919AK61_9PROT|nr:hypothetical protein GCM10017044_01380 [Kordiimonas sediminis]